MVRLEKRAGNTYTTARRVRLSDKAVMGPVGIRQAGAVGNAKNLTVPCLATGGTYWRSDACRGEGWAAPAP